MVNFKFKPKAIGVGFIKKSITISGCWPFKSRKTDLVERAGEALSLDDAVEGELLPLSGHRHTCTSTQKYD
jgi:hypothetical protein